MNEIKPKTYIDSNILSKLNVTKAGQVVSAETWNALWKLMIDAVNADTDNVSTLRKQVQDILDNAPEGLIMNTYGGFAAGEGSSTEHGGSIGMNTHSTDGFAGGANAEALAEGATQFGVGVNNTPHSMQFEKQTVIVKDPATQEYHIPLVDIAIENLKDYTDEQLILKADKVTVLQDIQAAITESKQYTDSKINEAAHTVMNVEIEDDGFGGYRTIDYNDNAINNHRNAGGIVQAKYYNQAENQTYTYYYSTMESDRKPTFIRTFINADGKTEQVLASVGNDKKVTVERRVSGGEIFYATCNAEADPQKTVPNVWYIPKTMPKPSSAIGTMVNVKWTNGRVDGIGYDVKLIWGEEDGTDNEVIVDTANTDGPSSVNIPTGGTVLYQLIESNGRKRWKYVSGDLLYKNFSTSTSAEVADKVVPNLNKNYINGMEIYLQLDNGNTADVMRLVPDEGATLPVYGNGIGAKTGPIEKGYILHLKNAGDHWQILNSGASQEYVDGIKNNLDDEINLLTGEVSDTKQEIGLIQKDQTLQNKAIQKNVDDIIAERNYANDTFAPVIKNTASGEAVAVDDVSSVPHKVTVKCSSVNEFSLEKLRTSHIYAPKGNVAFGENSVKFTTTQTGYCFANIEFKFQPQQNDNYIMFAEVNTSKTNLQEAGVSLIGKTTGNNAFFYTGKFRALPLSNSDTYTFQINIWNANIGDYFELKNIKLEQGKVSTPYTPFYKDTEIASANVLAQGKNILTYPFAETTKTVNGITFTDNGDGTITANGTATGRADFFILNNAKGVIVQDAFLSGCPKINGCRIQLGTLKTVYFNDTGSGVLVTKTTESSGAIQYIGLTVFPNTVVNNAVFKPMLSYNLVNHSYETPIKPVSYPIGDDLSVTVNSISPNMTMFADKQGILLNAEYNADTTITVNKLKEKINKLTSALLSTGGNV